MTLGEDDGTTRGMRIRRGARAAARGREMRDEGED